MSDSDKDWGFSLQHPDNAPRASGRANEGRQAVNDYTLEPRLRAEPMSNWDSDRDYSEGWNAALRAAGKFWGFEPRYSDWTLWLKAQREAATPPPVASSPVGGEQHG